MSRLLEGKTALILGVANQWSLAWAIAQAFAREGAGLLLTYQGERPTRPLRQRLPRSSAGTCGFPQGPCSRATHTG